MTEWLNICTGCGHQETTHGADLPGQCPRCKGWSWCCRWLNASKPVRHNHVNPPSESNHTDELCHPITDAAVQQSGQDKWNPQPPDGARRRRGRPAMPIPDGIIEELVGRNYGAKRIALELEARGITVSSRTINRRLQGALFS